MFVIFKVLSTALYDILMDKETVEKMKFFMYYLLENEANHHINVKVVYISIQFLLFINRI